MSLRPFARSINPPADHDFLGRITKQKRYAHGVLHSIRSTTTMPTGFRQTTSQSQRLRGRCRNRSETWNCNARNEWTFWKRCERVGRRQKPTETGQTAARPHEAGHRCLRSLIIHWDIRQTQDGLGRVLCLQSIIRISRELHQLFLSVLFYWREIPTTLQQIGPIAVPKLTL